MPSEKTLINKLKKIEDCRFEDHASQLLFYYCKGVNSFHHRLGKGLDIPLAQKGKNGDLILTHDTDMCVYIDNAFHQVDRDCDLAIPKKERFHNLNISNGMKSVLHNMPYLMDKVVDTIRADPKLKNGFNFY